MANTLKTLTGELMVSEVESITLVKSGTMMVTVGKSVPAFKVTAVSKSGGNYDLVSGQTEAVALKVLSSAMAFVAGIGHQVFDPVTVKL